tara:strand:+ start:1279 stop:1482 length:204 start_codon:yes stop_codon:yes gene_type:complete
MKPLIEYFNDGLDAVASAADWKYVGKVVLVFIPVILFTAWYWTVKVIWLGTDYINKKGDDFLVEFMK